MPCLQLIAGDTSTKIDKNEISPLHELSLKFIFDRAIPNEQNKEQWKTELLEKISTISDETMKEFNTQFLNFSVEDPYDSFSLIKKMYPAWLSEYLLYLWDTSGMLNEEAFREASGEQLEGNTTIIESATKEYVNYLISLQ